MRTLTPDAWAAIRRDYEHSDKLIHEICAEHGISTGTLRDRMRRWGWTRRRPPIPSEGPPPVSPRGIDGPPRAMPCIAEASSPAGAPQPGSGAPPGPDAPQHDDAGDGLPSPHLAPHDGADAVDPAQTIPRLQGAIARVLPAIEANLAALAAGPAHPREMERAARAVTSLTRTLRELTALLDKAREDAAASEENHKTLDEFRAALARKMDNILAEPDDGEDA